MGKLIIADSQVLCIIEHLITRLHKNVILSVFPLVNQEDLVHKLNSKIERFYNKNPLFKLDIVGENTGVRITKILSKYEKSIIIYNVRLIHYLKGYILNEINPINTKIINKYK